MPENWICSIDRFGRVTIPAELRKQLGLHPGTVVVFTPIRNGLLLQTRREWNAQKKRRD